MFRRKIAFLVTSQTGACLQLGLGYLMYKKTFFTPAQEESKGNKHKWYAEHEWECNIECKVC